MLKADNNNEDDLKSSYSDSEEKTLESKPEIQKKNRK